MTLPPALEYLARYDQFILWRLEPKRIASDGKEYATAALRKAKYTEAQIAKLPEGKGKPDKVPYNASGSRAGSALLSDNWLPWATAATRADTLGEPYGVGFVLTADNDLFCLDIDGCAEPNGQWKPIVSELAGMLPGCAIEISTTGTGLHLWGRYRGDAPSHGKKNIPLGLELYTADRYIALGRPGVNGDAATDLTDALPAVIARYFARTAPGLGEGDWQAQWENALQAGVHADWNGFADDSELLKKARRSRSANALFGNTATFAQIWDANADKLSEVWPDERGYDASSADAALAQHLAFWTGKDAARIDRLMRKSNLIRDKWEDRPDYLPRTILHAVSVCREVYSRFPKSDPTPRDQAQFNPELLAGMQYLPQAGLPEHFAGCVYILTLHKAFTRKGLLKADQFRVAYGGYEFQMDVDSKTTMDAWKAFTESRCVHFPQVTNAVFRPELESGAMIEENGETAVNVYIPVNTRRVVGDASPFLQHITKLIPDPKDYALLLSYLAACVQYPGVKFQWCPLIQGAEGNGKTLFTRCLIYAIGDKYAHMPPAEHISEKFNAWLFGKLFIGIEDIYVPGHKFEILNVLKPMITNDRLSQRAMQTDQAMGDNRANFIMNSNHRDAIRKTKNDRRFAVFYTAQQTERDMIDSGFMKSNLDATDYFPKLYAWLKADGYAIVNDYLRSYSIPDAYNPATECHRAPRTSSTEAALRESLGVVEQTIMEAVEEARTGFRGGWISSLWLGDLLRVTRLERFAPINRRKHILADLGYVPHPGLNDGRVTRVLLCDGGKKPRLFIRADSESAMLTDAQQIQGLYESAQKEL